MINLHIEKEEYFELHQAMVPFTTSSTDSLYSEFEVTVDGTNYGWKSVMIPIPSGGYLAGHCYMYNVYFETRTGSVSAKLSEKKPPKFKNLKSDKN